MLRLSAFCAISLLLLFAGLLGVDAHGRPSPWSKGAAGRWHNDLEEAAPSRELLLELEQQEQQLELDGTINRRAPRAAVTVSASPSLIAKNGDTVTVSWSGVTKVQADDWIGVYSPSTSEHSLYIDWVYVKECETASQGFGNVTFELVNMRKDYGFRYFSGNTVLTQLAQSAPVEFVNKNEPTHGRLAYPGDPTTMRVMWVTNEDKTIPTVQYGTSAGILNMNMSGTSHTYRASDICSPLASTPSPVLFIDPGFFHDVLLTNLAPSTLYWYRYGNDATGWSAVANFTTAPQPGKNTPISFVVYADMGTYSTGPGAVATSERVLSHLDDVDFVLHVGDLSYALGRGYVWEWFGALIEPIATNKPYQVSIGNHEYCHLLGGEKDPSHAAGNGFHPSWGNYGDDSNGECGVPTHNRFHMPDNGNSVFWYSFDYGSVHFLQFSAEHDFLPGSDMYKWIANDLASVDRSVTPWIFVSAHRPAYCSENYMGDYNVSLYLRAALEPLMQQYKVNIFFSGHYHSFQATCPVMNGTCSGTFDKPTAPVHLMVGMSGASLDNETYMNVTWDAFHDQAFGVAYVHVHDANSMYFEYRHNDNDGVAWNMTLSNWAML
ncbi:nucleotide pyrophosphatase/phosphodiesterase [Capsaspora owczarzaki ATCC 30864]|uniref:Purple acid phosphatase n=1 Tax=Capsaspora owczarzaki (strain ATCC 30864) TaxID=595528 RepID=A0A0D2WNR0_CAPO3|nr:nucleotide pyrophosphatase/phosphodiesterase [Capsaspora owczarzaki ATCC 30864]KJE92073.1 nucleotide pyrophosphatase/phosphodiesterase [Capsaspora owczarzaki ATCC 30864]|eukprot:XP_004363939.1 nucleotide pyrophosphatase/phosphodiesterase [Capsaspora owczarzaki ATCC 30864]